MEKGKRKELVCPWQEAISIYFWVIGMPYYQEGQNGTIKKYWSAQTSSKSLYPLLCLFGRIYPTKSDIFIKFQSLGGLARLDIFDQLNISGHRQVPEPWQPCLVGHIWPTRFIKPSSGSRAITPLLDLIYLTHPNSIMDLRLDSREGVLTKAMNNGAWETWEFR
jgi:hypothetical protein